jgi:putative addiction module component (TIGR02574 family)
MSLTLERIRDEALRLSAQERARLARELISSLDELEAEDEAAVEAAWREEVRRRLEQYRRGEIGVEEGDAVMEEVRARFRK